MPPVSYHIRTFGCQMNERDSEIIAALLEKRGMVRAAVPGEAGVFVINSCSVREHAEQRVLSMLGRLKEWREGAPGRVLVLAGCMAAVRDGAFRHRFPQVDVLVGPANLLSVPDLVAAVLEGGPPQIAVSSERVRGARVPEFSGARPAGFSAWVKIMEGCDHACSFCVVPQARGGERSRPFEEIVADVERMVAEGVVEVTLLGQTVNAYGRRAGAGADFAALLGRLSAVPGLKRIRFTSPHPVYHTESVLRAMGENAAVCEQMHLPVQSGSDRILKAMRRGHTAAFYLDIVDRSRSLIRGVSVTTDIIVGFPGETEEDFSATLDLVGAAGFSGAFSFKYSPRPGTPAAAMSGQVPEEVKEERLARLNSRLDENSRRANESLVGSAAEVLVERPGEDGKTWEGRLRSNRLVVFDSDAGTAPGQMRMVEITSAATWSLTGRLATPVAG